MWQLERTSFGFCIIVEALEFLLDNVEIQSINVWYEKQSCFVLNDLVLILLEC